MSCQNCQVRFFLLLFAIDRVEILNVAKLAFLASAHAAKLYVRKETIPNLVSAGPIRLSSLLTECRAFVLSGQKLPVLWTGERVRVLGKSP